jgi:hypothetical protein
MPRSKSRHKSKAVSGIYSFFIRGAEIRVMPKDIEKLKQHAIKVVEGEDLMLIVGKNWLVMIDKIHGYEHEYIRIRCFPDMCEPHREIEMAEILNEVSIPTTVETICREELRIDRSTDDYECEVRYNYISYSAIIAITIDPLDINRLNNDKELQLLLNLMKTSRILVRPM